MVTCVRKAAVFLMSAAVLLQPTFANHHSNQQVGSCRYGMFDDRQRGAEPGRLNCRPCSRCMPGYGASRLCIRYNDTECSPCSPGHYSATTSSLDSCIPCTVCGRREPEQQACTVKSDAVCRKHCPIGSFYNPFDEDCLPCSSCRNYPKDEANSVRVQQCVEDGMVPDMQCWPHPDLIDQDMSSVMSYDYSEDQSTDYDSSDKEPPTTVAYYDYRVRPVGPSPRPGQVSNEDTEPDNTEDMARMYTVVLLTLLIVVGLCVFLSITILVCLCRVMKMSSHRSSYQRTNSGGYHCISEKTSKLLVRQPTTYV
ncbi:tumor necrosis factor receptor superfamily member 4-like isoform X2 [Patiria miniata]|uniref:TNFR-Cys domain-containing protein n=1 Tax=Patiria miniata TaxID=46514 RepID=A0A913ZUI8_PATMI|nr:tumor necrosis factor receptor superfamily member 4-like isoform X2 [Patiria miniata]